MKGKKGSSRLKSYFFGIISGMVCTICALYMANIYGTIIISTADMLSPYAALGWFSENLGLSLVPFSLIALGYLYQLRRLNKLLAAQTPSPTEIYAAEEKIDLLINLFFGIGVIWTAIGMRNALLASLGNMDAEIAARKGAFYILTQLVEGGILLALSTTIVGGFGGYLMRVIKAWSTGRLMNEFAENQLNHFNQDILQKLDTIATLIERSNPRQEGA